MVCGPVILYGASYIQVAHESSGLSISIGENMVQEAYQFKKWEHTDITEGDVQKSPKWMTKQDSLRE